MSCPTLDWEVEMKYRQLIGMVLRLIEEGMDEEKAIRLVSHTYASDPDQLREWIANH